MRESLVIAVAQPLCRPYDVAVNAATHARDAHLSTNAIASGGST